MDKDGSYCVGCKKLFYEGKVVVDPQLYSTLYLIYHPFEKSLEKTLCGGCVNEMAKELFEKKD